MCTPGGTGRHIRGYSKTYYINQNETQEPLEPGLLPGVCVLLGVQEDILGGIQKHITSIKMKHRNLLNLEPTLIFALAKISP
jgi:hypothetical protein